MNMTLDGAGFIRTRASPKKHLAITCSSTHSTHSPTSKTTNHFTIPQQNKTFSKSLLKRCFTAKNIFLKGWTKIKGGELE